MLNITLGPASVETAWHQCGPKYTASPGPCLMMWMFLILERSSSSVIGMLKQVGIGTLGKEAKSSGDTKYHVFVPTSWKVSESMGAQCIGALSNSFAKFEVNRLF
jgi:hypothetical protein